MDQDERISGFMNAKIELSVAIQNLSTISETFLQTVDIPEEEVLGDKLTKLRVAIETADLLVNSLNDIFSESNIEEVNVKGEPIHEEIEAWPRHFMTESLEEVDDSSEKSKPMFSCDICRKTLSGAYELKRHIRRVHLGERERSPKPRSRGKGDFVCNICNKTLSGAYELKRHKTQKHQEDKPFPCDFCKKTFADRNKLMIHRRTHTGEKPFACDNCPKAFTAVCKLNWHIKNECQKIFLCKECGKTFSGDYELNRHIKHLHLDAVRPYSCELCPKTFFEPSKLELHVRTHTGERPFPCDLCVKAFVSKSKLKLHKDMVHGVSEQLYNFEDNESSDITIDDTCTKDVKIESE